MTARHGKILWENDIFALSISSLFLFFFIIVYLYFAEQEAAKDKERLLSNRRIVHIALVLFGGFTLHFALKWAMVRYPLLEPYTVIFTLSMPLKGMDSETFSSAFNGVILPASLFLGISLLGMLSIKKYSCLRLKLRFCVGRWSLILSYIILFSSIFTIFYTLPVSGYFEAAAKQKLPVENSEFYIKYYADPNKTKITFPQKKKNLILILLESIESSFLAKKTGGLFEKDYIPELTRLASENINFSHTQLIGGGKDLWGTHWTIASMVAKLCGIPFNLPIFDNTTFFVDFLPGAKGLTDILHEHGYRQRFLFGSDKNFASRGQFMKTHKVEVHDLIYYKEKKKVPEDYYVFWGIEDAKLFALAKEELDEISSHGEPFMLGLLTTDTHFPDGYICELCAPDKNSEIPAIFTVLRCASRQTENFIKYIKSKPWYKDTVIVVLGDHLFMDKKIFPENQESRRWLNIFINSSIAPIRSKGREFSSFDMYPTILESMGAKIQGGSLALGRSLFSDRPTIIEEIGLEEYINENLSRKSLQYNKFIYDSDAAAGK
ncbi:MAG: LTA synthase family protein [Leptospirales bacterium]|nr:LTA synthase family protein [Leptospirales bacterium]